MLRIGALGSNCADGDRRHAPKQYIAPVPLAMAQVCWNPADTAAQPAVTADGTVTAVGASLSAVSPEMPSCPDPPDPARKYMQSQFQQVV